MSVDWDRTGTNAGSHTPVMEGAITNTDASVMADVAVNEKFSADIG
jgi:hypothetical protein